MVHVRTESSVAKIPCVILLGLTILIPAFAQDAKSRIGAGENGEFGTVVVNVGTVGGSSAVLVGGRGGWILDQTFAIGGAGYILTSNVKTRSVDSLGNNLLTMSYGGLHLEYQLLSDGPIHLAFQGLVGAGAAGYHEASYTNPREHFDGFFVVEPSVNAAIDVAEVFRIGAGVSYRSVHWLNSQLASNSDLSGPSVGMTLSIVL